MRDHEVGAEPLRDIEHLRAHLHRRRRNGEGLELEAFLRREILDHLDRLAAGRIVVEEVRDLLALEVAAELLLREIDAGRSLRPVRRGDREDVGILYAVGGGGAAEARRRAGNAIFGQLRRQRVDVRRAVDGHRHGAFLLVALVGLDTLRHFVLVVDLQRVDLVALDATLRIHQRDVVVEAGAQDRAHDLGGPRPITLHADDDLALGLCVGRRAGEQAARRQHQRHRNSHVTVHDALLSRVLSTRMARHGSSSGCCATGGSAPRAPA